MIAVSEKLEEETSVVGDCPKITHDFDVLLCGFDVFNQFYFFF